MRDDMLRAQSQHEDLKKKLQQMELVVSDMKNKEELAREELQKEKVSSSMWDFNGLLIMCYALQKLQLTYLQILFNHLQLR